MWSEANQSVAESRRWYEKAAKQNHPDAVDSFGVFYAKGQGCDVDLSKALEFFQRAMELDGGVSRLHRNANGLVDVAGLYLRALSILLPFTGTDPDNSDAASQHDFEWRIPDMRKANFNLHTAGSAR